MSTKREHVGPLNVTGEQITLDEDAAFTGPVTFNGPAIINGEFHATGPLTFRGQVIIDKDATIFVTPAREHEELIGLGGTSVSHEQSRQTGRPIKEESRVQPAPQAAVLSKQIFPATAVCGYHVPRTVRKIPAEERLYPGLKAERADTIVAGMVTIEEIMLRSGFSSLTVLPQGGVRHGILMRETFDSPGIPSQRAAVHQPRAVLAGVQ